MPRSNPSQVQAFSVREFFEEFTDDDACLKRIMEVRCGLRHVCGACGLLQGDNLHK